ncbi:hypothetical protein [Natrinema halophilum]|uniref:Uncharacterized protein n=1 Tax=Natrinema halophilum TaxID=1699371 RepID=A0A7D5KCA8_9EURY|nr:hypothetical protein [Natrinema halophilum]QLG48456.1 hypothetical protein HYG82_06140 [Natrinema halophilum]
MTSVEDADSSLGGNRSHIRSLTIDSSSSWTPVAASSSICDEDADTTATGDGGVTQLLEFEPAGNECLQG